MRNDSIAILDTLSIESKILVRFGLKQASLLIAFYLLCIGIGILTGKTLEMAVFMLATYSIRIYVGGFHANSKMNCLFISVALVFMGVVTLNVSNRFPILSVGVVIVTVLLIFKLAPIQDWHKPLSTNERIVFSRRSRSITLFWLFIYILSLISEFTKISNGVVASFFVISLVLLAGFIKNQIVSIKK